MTKVTQKQIDLINDLSEKYQKPCPEVEQLSTHEAWMWIRDVLEGVKNGKIDTAHEISPVQWGLSFKLVYRRWTEESLNPIKDQVEFIQEVRETYLLMQIN